MRAYATLLRLGIFLFMGTFLAAFVIQALRDSAPRSAQSVPLAVPAQPVPVLKIDHPRVVSSMPPTNATAPVDDDDPPPNIEH